MAETPIADDRDRKPTPDELRQEAEEAREDARQAAEARGLATDAIDALKELTEHDAVSIKRQHQLDLIIYMLGAIRHGEEWGYAAHYLNDHADNLEAEAELLEREEQADG